MPKISVIIPIYNVEKYIARCARSLFGQTLDDVEYIFIDDCSPDKSVDILNAVLNEDPHRISHTQIIRLPQNVGVATVRKMGIAIATGEYIANCDSDDWVDLDMYKLMYEEAVAHNHDIVRCLFTRCNETFSKKCHIIPTEIYAQKEKLQSCQLIGFDYNSLWDKIIRRQLFIDNDFIYPTFHMLEDAVIVTQALYYSCSVGYIDKVLYYYYQNPDSICHGFDEQKILHRLNHKKANVDLIIKFLEDRNIASRYSNEILILKYHAKMELLPLIYNPQYRNIWNSVYPEINALKICGIKKKCAYILGCLRLYSPVKNVYNKVRAMI